MTVFRDLRSIGALLLALILAAFTAPCAVQAQSIDALGTVPAPTGFYGSEDRATVAPAANALFSPVISSPGGTAPVLNEDRNRALDCMSWAIAYEAAGQPIAGQQAVGQVILNRLHHPNRPKTVCGVVFQGAERHTGCQFTFACDGSLARRLSSQTMLVARTVAEQVLDGAAPDHVGGATHYHADYVLPAWAATGRRVAQIGAHIFYAMPGDGMLAAAPVATIGEPDMAGAAPAVALSRYGQPASGISARAGRRAGRRSARAALIPVAAAPAATHSLFRPWGLPVGAQP